MSASSLAKKLQTEFPADERDQLLAMASCSELLWIAYTEFMALKIVSGDFVPTKLSPPPAVDALWHVHLLWTKSYDGLCAIVAGGQRIHHDPRSGLDGNEEDRKRRASTTKNLYGIVFGRECDWDWDFEKEKEAEEVLYYMLFVFGEICSDIPYVFFFILFVFGEICSDGLFGY